MPMTPRRSLKLPIVLAIVMTAILAILAVGWVLMAVFGASGERPTGIFWTFLAVGTSFIGLLLAGVIVYLTLTVKAVNLTRRQSNFIDSVTHELKSPIASMKLYLQTLTRRQVSEEQQASFHESMLEDVERLNHLINQVLDAAQIETGMGFDGAENVLVSELLHDCAERSRGRHRAPGEAIQFDLDPCYVRARPAQLQMLFRNLLDNAFKYAGSPPRIEVSLQFEEDRVAVARIGDNGPGVPHRLRRKIFGRFVRLGSELEREKPGTGLGLHIAHTIVRQLGGRVHVLDKETGTGAVFEVRLPASGAGDEGGSESDG
jgi:signal transduction histidine kinase